LVIRNTGASRPAASCWRSGCSCPAAASPWPSSYVSEA